MNDIIFKLGSVNPCGISDAVFYIPKHYIRRWPTIEDDFEALMQGRYAEYDGSFELQPGCWWSYIYSTQGKGKINWEYQGETDCKVVVNKATLSYPKLTNEVRAFAKFASNGDFVFCIKHDGHYHIIGNRDYRATVTPNGDSGDTAGSAKGVTIDIECPDTTPLPTYKGVIVLADGILDCDTDTFQNFEDMNTNKISDYSKQIEGGNSVRFEAGGNSGRIHIEGSGPIVMEVSVDGVTYKEVDHDIEFENGVAIAPFQFYIGDKVRLSATTLTKVTINYNDLKTN
jgi:hypothetical protein